MPNDALEDYQQIVQKFVRKKSRRRLKKDGTPYKTRAGWGPYRSVPNERAVAFNLQLDVQTLQQEVHNMSALRDILRTKMLLQRDARDGSFVRVVNEFFAMFRQGVPVQEVWQKRLAGDKIRDQREFLRSVMDPDVDAGSGLYGPDVMMDQMTIYSTFLRFLCFQMHTFNIVKADDSVIITTHSTLRFQIRRATIEKVFPHIMGEAWLVAQLVGQEVEPTLTVSFYFNAAGKCCKYAVDMDLVGAFAGIVKDPSIVDLLLGRALISDNCMFGLIDEPQPLEEEEKIAPPVRATRTVQVLEDERRSTACPTTCGAVEFCQRVVENIVEDYFCAFASGYQEDAVVPPEVSQRDFLLQRFASQMQAGVETTVNRVRERWRALSECFEVLSFQQKRVTQTECDRNCNVCLMECSAAYVLGITCYTIQSVFPHLVSNTPLLDILVGKVIVVPSQISFSVEKSTGRISRVNEKMNFAAAIAELLPDSQDLPNVVSKAFLAEDGVAYAELEGVGRRTMRMADILN